MERKPIAHMTKAELAAFKPDQLAVFVLGDNFNHDTLSRGAALNLHKDILDCLLAYGAARAAAERKRCLEAIAGLYHGDACRAAIRSLDTPADPYSYTCPGCGRPTNVIYNRANCPACAGQD